ncbi:hypothetical protein K435DRAFT_959250 [Dendrothele bispora CBS 962.96]|uniref:F-box domain-containing protein n=1 Tax=Dendrothele bispora (strain CBS 962.96) TaxID=1314807 RepID=A0A4S8MZW4_DENBC|nr:hypothetical protein K435DRAFT_959250 [Dendrothele bispora CBS 962.96]
MDDLRLPELPLEIWSIVFDAVDFPSLHSVSSTCRSFRWLLYRRLYRTLTIICEYSYDLTSQRRGLTDTFNRLEFFTSALIAPCLQSCTILFRRWPDPDFEPILDILCERLSRFTNLKRLVFENVLITSQRARFLSQTTPLQYLSFSNCNMEPDVILDRKIFADALSLCYVRDRCPDDPPNQWLSLLNTSNISHLYLDARSSALETLSEIATYQIQLPCIKVIHLNCEDDVVTSEHLPTALSMCSSLSKLHLQPRKGGMVVSFPHVFQHLSMYEGPHYFLPSLQGYQKELRRVKLFGDRYQGICDLIDIREDFRYFHSHAPNLESMYLRAFPTSELCHSIAELFPNLRSLAFWLPLQTQALCPMLALTQEPFLPSLMKMSLPLRLENLVILGMLFSNSNQLQGSQIIENLTSKYPSLRHIYLYFPQGDWFTWSRFPDVADDGDDNGKVGPDRGAMAFNRFDVTYDWFS